MTALWSHQTVVDVAPALLDGLVVTVLSVVGGFSLAAILGLGFAVARRSAGGVVRQGVVGALDAVRGTPLLVQLYLVHYVVLPALGVPAPAWVTGVVTLGVHYGTYTAEVYRAGIEGVPQGQWDAARSVGLSRADTWRLVVLPQAIPPSVPALGNYLIAMFKDTPLLAAIGVGEVLLQALDHGATHFRYLEPLTLVGLAYLVLSWVSGRAVRHLEHRMALEPA